MKNIKPYAPAIVWGIFIFALSVWPGKDFPKLDWGDLLSVDKLVHIVFYALLTALILLSEKWKVNNEKLADERGVDALEMAKKRRKMRRFAVMTAVGCTAYGWFLEWFQEHYCQDRLFDWFDGLANTMGAFGALAVFVWRGRR